MHGTRRRQKSDDEQVYAGQSRRAQLTVQGDPEKREQRFVERLVVPRRIDHGFPYKIAEQLGSKGAFQTLTAHSRVTLKRHLQAETRMGKALCFTAAGHRQVIGPESCQAIEKIAAKLFEGASHLARQLTAKLNDIARIARAGVGLLDAGAIPGISMRSRAGVPFFQICNASRGYRTHTIRKGTLPKPPHHIVHQIRFRRVRVVHRAHGHATRRREC